MTRHLAAVPDKPGRVVLYVRVSALMGRGGEDFHSPDVQLTAMRRATAGMREVAVIDDDIDVSGRSFDRDGLDRVRELVEDGQVDTLAVYNLARFGRNVIQGLTFLNWLADRGVTIVSASEHIDTSTPSGRWMLTTMLALAEMRSDEIGLEWAQTIHRRAREGKHHGSVPTGYERGADGRLVEHPAKGPAMRQAFRDYAAGETASGIRQRLAAATGLRMSTTVFKTMMRNRAYLGTVRVRGAGGVVEVEGAHIALVDPDTWDDVQQRLSANSKIPPRHVEPHYALTGLCRCGRCDQGVSHHPDDKKTGVVRLRCIAHTQAKGKCDGCGALNAEHVVDAILVAVAEHISLLRSNVAEQAATMAKAQRAAIDAKTIRAELDATRRAIANATERWARDLIDDRAYQDAVASLRGEEDRLSSTLAGLRHAVGAATAEGVVALGERLLALWPRMNGTQRNRALRDLIDHVVILPSERYRQPASERVDIRWR